jgi:hypothetical protein
MSCVVRKIIKEKFIYYLGDTKFQDSNIFNGRRSGIRWEGLITNAATFHSVRAATLVDELKICFPNETFDYKPV